MNDITANCLIICGACGTPLPNVTHGEACECLLRHDAPSDCWQPHCDNKTTVTWTYQIPGEGSPATAIVSACSQHSPRQPKAPR